MALSRRHHSMLLILRVLEYRGMAEPGSQGHAGTCQEPGWASPAWQRTSLMTSPEPIGPQKGAANQDWCRRGVSGFVMEGQTWPPQWPLKLARGVGRLQPLQWPPAFASHAKPQIPRVSLLDLEVISLRCVSIQVMHVSLQQTWLYCCSSER